MKQFFLGLSVTLMLFLSFQGCDSDNSFDGTQLLGESTQQASSYNPAVFVEAVLLSNVDNAITAATQMDTYANESLSSERVTAMQKTFTTLAAAMKRVEALYIAGDYNRSLIDTLQFVDIFRIGKSDIQDQLDFIARSSSDVETLLFQNSLKSINAMEYLLYDTDANTTILQKFTANTRYVQMLSIMAKSIASQYTTIRTFYTKGALFSNNEQFADIMLNVIIDSSYKLREWRIGDPGGFTNASSGQPDAAQLEYPLAHYSIGAMLAIVTVHQRLFSENADSFATYCIDLGAENEITAIRTQLSELRTLLLTLDDQEGVVSSLAFEELYRYSNALFSLYSNSLVSALQEKSTINIGIIEADGD